MEATNWQNIIGQTQLTNNLKNTLKYNKISHAYLLQGEKLSGKNDCQSFRTRIGM